jgi:hypothetical protein
MHIRKTASLQPQATSRAGELKTKQGKENSELASYGLQLIAKSSIYGYKKICCSVF